MSKPVEKSPRPKLADFPEYVAIVAKHRELTRVLVLVQGKIDELVAAIGESSAAQREFNAAERARQLIDGKKDISELGVQPIDEGQARLKLLRQQRDVATEAIRLHKEESQPIISELRHRIREAVEPTHKQLGLRVGQALDALIEACAAEQAFRDAVAVDTDPKDVGVFASCPLPHAGFPGRTPQALVETIVDRWRRDNKDYLGVPQIPPPSPDPAWGTPESRTSWRPPPPITFNPP